MRDEHTAPKEHFRELHGKDKLRYIWDYYKLPIFAIVVAVYVLGFTLYGHFTKKDAILYIAAVNVNLGDETVHSLTDRFIETVSANPKKEEVYLFQDLLLSDSPEADVQYVAASRMKLLAAINSHELDVVLLPESLVDDFNEEGYFSDSFCVDEAPCIKAANYTEPIYLGIISNTPREEIVAAYCQYLFAPEV